MRWPELRRRAARVRLVALVVLPVVAWPAAAPLQASSVGDAATEPVGRGRLVLEAREAVLREQTERAERAARRRGRDLYRVLRFATLERRAGAAGDGVPHLGGRAVALGSAVLERDLAEARSLRAEWERVRAAREALSATGPAPVAPTARGARVPVRLPRLARPVAGPVNAPYGLARDVETNAWTFRTAIGFRSSPGESVRSPLAGRVVRVAPSLAGGDAVVLASDADGWTVIVSGLAEVAVTQGAAVQRGDTLGRAPSPPAGDALRLELWRGRVPVDPAALLD